VTVPVGVGVPDTCEMVAATYAARPAADGFAELVRVIDVAATSTYWVRLAVEVAKLWSPE
jgi:hypothetical protein